MVVPGGDALGVLVCVLGTLGCVVDVGGGWVDWRGGVLIHTCAPQKAFRSVWFTPVPYSCVRSVEGGVRVCVCASRKDLQDNVTVELQGRGSEELGVFQV